MNCSKMKVVVFTEFPRLGPFNKRVFCSMLDIENVTIIGVIFNPRPKRTLYEMYRVSLRRKRGSAMIVMAIQRLTKRIKRRGKDNSVRIKDLPCCGELPVERVSSLKRLTPEANLLITQADMAVFIGYHQIVKADFINRFKYGVLSYHFGDLRKYRGQPPLFYEILNGERKVGTVVQLITEDLDGGYIVSERSIPLLKRDSLITASKRVDELTWDMMAEAMRRVMTPGFVPLKPEELGRIYSIPKFGQWLLFHLKVIFRRLLYSREK